MAADSKVPVSRKLADYLTTASKLPDPVLRAAQASLIDGIAVSIAASSLTQAARPFLDIAHQTSHGQGIVLGFGSRCSAPMAAWVNGALAHGIDYEDTHDFAIAHPHAAAIAAVMAMIDELPGPVTGEDLLTAVALAGDVVCRLALSFEVNPDTFGWQVTPWLGVFGAATAAGRLLNLNADQMLSAWSLAMNQMAAFGEHKYSPASDVRSVRDAFAAKAGVLGAMLAARGVLGYDEPLEGKAGFLNGVARDQYSPDPILDQLGEVFRGAEVSFKPWPSCRGTHSYIESGLAISAMPDFDPARIDDIEIVINQKNEMLCVPEDMKKAPDNAIGAKFSIAFTLATALVKGEVTIGSFEQKALHDPAILKVAAKVRHVLDPTIPVRQTTKGSVTVNAGRDIFFYSVDQALGHPDKPLSGAQQKAKFDDCFDYAAQPFDVARRLDLWTCLNGMTALDDARKLTQLLATG